MLTSDVNHIGATVRFTGGGISFLGVISSYDGDEWYRMDYDGQNTTGKDNFDYFDVGNCYFATGDLEDTDGVKPDRIVCHSDALVVVDQLTLVDQEPYFKVGDYVRFDNKGLIFLGTIEVDDKDGWYRLSQINQNQSEYDDKKYFLVHGSFFDCDMDNIVCRGIYLTLANKDQNQIAVTHPGSEDALEIGDKVFFKYENLSFYGAIDRMLVADDDYCYVKATYENKTGISDLIYYRSNNSAFDNDESLICCDKNSLTKVFAVGAPIKQTITIQDKVRDLGRRVDAFIFDRTYVTTKEFFNTLDDYIEKNVDAETFKKVITALYEKIDFPDYQG